MNWVERIFKSCYYLLNSAFWGWFSMESQPQNPDFWNNPENFHPWVSAVFAAIAWFICWRQHTSWRVCDCSPIWGGNFGDSWWIIGPGCPWHLYLQIIVMVYLLYSADLSKGLWITNIRFTGENSYNAFWVQSRATILTLNAPIAFLLCWNV